MSIKVKMFLVVFTSYLPNRSAAIGMTTRDGPSIQYEGLTVHTGSETQEYQYLMALNFGNFDWHSCSSHWSFGLLDFACGLCKLVSVGLNCSLGR